MPDENWKPPPGQEDRERRQSEPDGKVVRKLETRGRDTDVNHDARFNYEEINTHGSER